MDLGQVQITPPPEVDTASLDRFACQLAEVPAGTKVILDFAEVRFMDSAGVRLLSEQDNRQRTAGGSVVVLNAPHLVRKLLEVAELDALMDTSSD